MKHEIIERCVTEMQEAIEVAKAERETSADVLIVTPCGYIEMQVTAKGYTEVEIGQKKNWNDHPTLEEAITKALPRWQDVEYVREEIDDRDAGWNCRYPERYM